MGHAFNHLILRIWLLGWKGAVSRGNACEEWRVKSGEWRVESGEWRVESIVRFRSHACAMGGCGVLDSVNICIVEYTIQASNQDLTIGG